MLEASEKIDEAIKLLTRREITRRVFLERLELYKILKTNILSHMVSIETDPLKKMALLQEEKLLYEESLSILLSLRDAARNSENAEESPLPFDILICTKGLKSVESMISLINVSMQEETEAAE